jgi:hypothetical protein
LCALQKTGTDDEIICHFFTWQQLIFVVVNLFFSFLNDLLLFWMVDVLKIEKKNVGTTSSSKLQNGSSDESEPETVEQLGLFNLSFFFFCPKWMKIV